MPLGILLPGWKYLLVLGLVVGFFAIISYLVGRRAGRDGAPIWVGSFVFATCLVGMIGLILVGVSFSDVARGPASQAPGWTHYTGTVAQLDHTVTRGGRSSDSVATTDGKRVVIKPNAVFLPGSTISYACGPDYNGIAGCAEGTAEVSYKVVGPGLAWIWWLVGATVAVIPVPYLMRYFGAKAGVRARAKRRAAEQAALNEVLSRAHDHNHGLV